MPKRLPTKIADLEGLCAPAWLPPSKKREWYRLSPATRRFLNGRGGAPDLLRALLAALSPEQLAALSARLDGERDQSAA